MRCNVSEKASSCRQQRFVHPWCVVGTWSLSDLQLMMKEARFVLPQCDTGAACVAVHTLCICTQHLQLKFACSTCTFMPTHHAHVQAGTRCRCIHLYWHARATFTCACNLPPTHIHTRRTCAYTYKDILAHISKQAKMRTHSIDTGVYARNLVKIKGLRKPERALHCLSSSTCEPSNLVSQWMCYMDTPFSSLDMHLVKSLQSIPALWCPSLPASASSGSLVQLPCPRLACSHWTCANVLARSVQPILIPWLL